MVSRDPEEDPAAAGILSQSEGDCVFVEADVLAEGLCWCENELCCRSRKAVWFLMAMGESRHR
jgi:hypothetical protein